jgi:stalled ribosome rescue protein Dom34
VGPNANGDRHPMTEVFALRSSDPTTRKKYVQVTEAIQQRGGEVLIFSSMHESGQREGQLFSIYVIDFT